MELYSISSLGFRTQVGWDFPQLTESILLALNIESSNEAVQIKYFKFHSRVQFILFFYSGHPLPYAFYM
jgi:hypothetical protein